MITGIGHFSEGYMFFIGDTPMNCAGGWRMFWSEDIAYSYLKPDERLPETTLRRVRVAVEVVE